MLALFALVLLTLAYRDFRASSPHWERHHLSTRGRVIANEMIATTAWLTLLLANGTIAVHIGLYYPAL
jgi:hypothetical protein